MEFAMPVFPDPTADHDEFTQAPGAAPEAAGSSTAQPRASRSALLTGEFISQVLSVGVTSSCDHLKQTLTTAIADKGDVYFAEALERARGSAQRLLGWSKQHPIKAACALTAAFGVAAVALAVVQNRRQGTGVTLDDTDLPRPAGAVEPLPSASDADVAFSG
jgi:hypothetical protein